ncbi:hypothetical protein FRC02_005078, partial [Tulasnella sp. 418]
MLSLPESLMDKALPILVEGVTGFNSESLDQVTELTQSSQKGELLQFVRQAFDSHIQKRILRIRRQINELLPIYKLPDELLQQIFLDACGIGYRGATKLAAVSWRWRSVSTSYARLWNYLHSDLDIEATKMMIQRSKTVPLDLICSCESKSKVNSFFTLLIPLSMRWRSLKVYYDNTDKLSLDFLDGQSFPLLEHLTLISMDDFGDYTLGRGNLNIIAPSIRELETMGLPLPLRLDYGTPSMLTTLLFTAAINGVPFLPVNYHALLTSTPHLRHLGIRGVHDIAFLEADLAAPLKIDLPYLESLEFDGLGYKTIGFLLSSIVTPSGRYPKVDVDGDVYGSVFSMFSLPPIENSVLAGFSSCDQSKLMTLEASVGVHMDLGAGDDRIPLLTLAPLDSASPSEDLSIIMTMLLSGIKKLEVHGLGVLLYGLANRLHLLPRLEKIKIRSGEEDDDLDFENAMERIVTFIAFGSSPNDPSLGICPLLRHIALDTFHFNLDVLEELVVARTTKRNGEVQNEGHLELVELGEKFDKSDPGLKLLQKLATERDIELRVGKLP